jgi:hypothetical protein
MADKRASHLAFAIDLLRRAQLESGMASLKPLEEVNMRKLFVTVAAVATLLATGALTTRSDAMTPGAPAGLRAAIESTSPVAQVRWGYHHRHHRHFWMCRHHPRHCR